MGERKPLLLIEDDDDIRETIAELLADAGYTVHLASNGKEGLEKLRSLSSRLGVCILDRYMPVFSGERVLRELAAQPDQPGSGVPIVVLSAAEGKPDFQYLVSDFLHKPLELSELLRVVDRYCGN